MAGRGLETTICPETSDARHRPFASQPTRFREFSGGMTGLAFTAVGCGKPGMDGWVARMSAARLLEPDDRILGTRLQQTRLSKAKIDRLELGILGAKKEGLFQERDCLVYQTEEHFTLRDLGKGADGVAIVSERYLIFGNRLRASALHS